MRWKIYQRLCNAEMIRGKTDPFKGAATTYSLSVHHQQHLPRPANQCCWLISGATPTPFRRAVSLRQKTIDNWRKALSPCRLVLRLWWSVRGMQPDVQEHTLICCLSKEHFLHTDTTTRQDSALGRRVPEKLAAVRRFQRKAVVASSLQAPHGPQTHCQKHRTQCTAISSIRLTPDSRGPSKGRRSRESSCCVAGELPRQVLVSEDAFQYCLGCLGYSRRRSMPALRKPSTERSFSRRGAP